jgi:hypothetical protein
VGETEAAVTMPLTHNWRPVTEVFVDVK